MSSSSGTTYSSLWKLAAYTVAGIVCLPIVMLFLQWGTIGNGEQEIWEHLLNTQLDRLLVNTLILIVGVGIGVSVVGVSLAWLTALCEFPGRRFFEWALMLPLAIPGYVMAFVFLGLFNFTGPIQTTLRSLFGADSYFPDIQGPAGVIVVFTLVLYPYVYMLARSAFVTQGRGMMDAGRILGLSPWQAFCRVAVPIARPAIVAGIALALMETLADFGAVSVFNYDTFTTAIYNAWYGLFNLAVASQLASLLLLFVAVTLVLEKQGRGQAQFALNERQKNHHPYDLKGATAWCSTAACTLVLLIAFFIPLGQLLIWCVGTGTSELDDRYFSFFSHTLILGVLAAVVTVMIALVLAFSRRLPGSRLALKWRSMCIRIATLGYALPGSVLAVGIILSFTLLDRTLIAGLLGVFDLPVRPLLVGSVFALVLAYSTRFLAVAHAPLEAGLERVSQSIVDAAKCLGADSGRLLRQVYIPMLRPGLITALIIVFVDVMKEMPATLIMRPFGWDTLAVRIFQMTAEGQWERAALPALTLILAGLIPVVLLIRSSRRQYFIHN